MKMLHRLAAVLFCTLSHVAIAAQALCTTLATDSARTFRVGYLSDASENASREFAVQFHGGPVQVFSTMGTCRPTVKTLAPGVFLVSVDSCGSALEANYFVLRSLVGANTTEIVDALLARKFFVADYQARPMRDDAIALRLRYVGQYELPYMPSEITIVVNAQGFKFSRQRRYPLSSGNDNRLSRLVYQDLYRIGFQPASVAEGHCGPFRKETRTQAESLGVDLCGYGRQHIAEALRYLQSTPQERLGDVESRFVSGPQRN
ncbi:hypothetical protein LBW59_08135 [Ralstonia solanacearum]|uniref:Uncharacterized protein n=1 Tax=Ralstonia solanacearum TaxID=305 RepID=A0AAW5ZM81_RALSL|nr:hypothetical protein [Ralstonia solanacearum]MDB0570740.1 hypothetical protein [Ralstonia solanacearum]